MAGDHSKSWISQKKYIIEYCVFKDASTVKDKEIVTAVVAM